MGDIQGNQLPGEEESQIISSETVEDGSKNSGIPSSLLPNQPNFQNQIQPTPPLEPALTPLQSQPVSPTPQAVIGPSVPIQNSISSLAQTAVPGQPMAPVQNDSALLVSSSRRKKTMLYASMVVVILLFISIIGAAATYRFAPTKFFALVPGSFALRLNTAWPLHQTIADMLPAETSAVLTINWSNDQSSLLKNLLNRVPGYSDAGLTALNEAKTEIKKNYSIDIDQSIGAFDTQFNMVVVDTVKGQTDYFGSLKITDFTKAEELLAKIQPSLSNTKIKLNVETYQGMTIYTLEGFNYQVPAAIGPTLQTLNKVFSNSKNIASASSIGCKSGGLTACAADSVSVNQKNFSFALVDRHIIFAESLEAARRFVDMSLSRKATLSNNKQFTSQAPLASKSLASFYVNLNKLGQSLELNSTEDINSELTAGYGSYGVSISAEDNGFIGRVYESFDTAKINKDLAGYLFNKEGAFEYLSKLPKTTSYMSEGSALGSGLKYISAFKLDKSSTVDQLVESSAGFKLSDIASALSGKFSFSVLPDSKLAIVAQAKINDAAVMNQYVTKIRELVENEYPLTTQSVNGVAIYSAPAASATILDELWGTSTFPKAKEYLNLSIAVSNDQLIIATNPEGIKTVLSPSDNNTLSADTQLIDNQKTVGNQGSSLVHLDSQRFYGGIVNAIREITNNPDKSVSNQEKVIAAMLKVFPGFTMTSRGNNGVATSTAIIPVVELPKNEKDEIEIILKNDKDAIFDLSPFFSSNYFGTSSISSPSSADEQDIKKKSDASKILSSVLTANSNSTEFNIFKTNGDEKLNPSTETMSAMIRDGYLTSANNDPEWPNYFYTLNNNGSSVKISVLLNNKPTDNINCLPTIQVRNRWTWCVQQTAK